LYSFIKEIREVLPLFLIAIFLVIFYNKSMEIVVATNNKNKLKEIREILGGKIDKIYSQSDLGIVCEPEENAPDFAGNADIKARTIAAYCNLPVLADDSGLLVEALNGEPGVNSARYCGEHGNDAKNNELLLKNLQGVENRNATFATCVTLYFNENKILRVIGETKGKILHEKQGDNGFGYDCIFYSDELGKSFGLASEEEKNSVSHRGKALRKLLELL